MLENKLTLQVGDYVVASDNLANNVIAMVRSVVSNSLEESIDFQYDQRETDCPLSISGHHTINDDDDIYFFLPSSGQYEVSSVLHHSNRMNGGGRTLIGGRRKH